MGLPITRTHRPNPTHVEVEPGVSELEEISYINCEDLRTISPMLLERRFGLADETVCSGWGWCCAGSWRS